MFMYHVYVYVLFTKFVEVVNIEELFTLFEVNTLYILQMFF